MEKTITKKMIKQGYKQGIIHLITNPCTNNNETICQIGDNCFYFAGLTAEENTPEEYVKNVPEEDIIEEIYTTLDTCFKTEFEDEYLYYYYILKEQLVDKQQ